MAPPLAVALTMKSYMVLKDYNFELDYSSKGFQVGLAFWLLKELFLDTSSTAYCLMLSADLFVFVSMLVFIGSNTATSAAKPKRVLKPLGQFIQKYAVESDPRADYIFGDVIGEGPIVKLMLRHTSSLDSKWRLKLKRKYQGSLMNLISWQNAIMIT